MKQFSEYSPARRVVLFFSSGFMVGYIPFASGTFASILAIGLFAPLRLLNVPLFSRLSAFAAVLAVSTGVAVWLSGAAERIYGEKDSHKIVIDEIVGFFVAMVLVPFRWQHILAAFVLFRLFDVVKPPPIRGLQRLPGGVGVVIDDLLAGLYACVVLHVIMALGLIR